MKFDPVPYIIGVVAIVIAAIIIVFAGKSDNTGSANTQQIAEKEKGGEPIIATDETTFLLTPKEKIKQKTIKVANNGSGALVLSAFETSCKCVTGQFSKASEDGPDFFGRNKINWSIALPPDEEGLLSIRFDEKTFNWTRPSDQFVTFKTNDPNNPEIKVSFLTDPEKVRQQTETSESGDTAVTPNMLEQLKESGALDQENGTTWPEE
ncbi:MAG: hypothetical protein WCT32_01945 [Patescibacteria group bacterium]|jgi:hypothetical protein